MAKKDILNVQTMTTCIADISKASLGVIAEAPDPKTTAEFLNLKPSDSYPKN